METHVTTKKYWLLWSLTIVVSFFLGAWLASDWFTTTINDTTIPGTTVTEIETERTEAQTDIPTDRGVGLVSFAIEGQVIALSDTSITVASDAGEFMLPYNDETPIYYSMAGGQSSPTPIEDINELEEATVSVTLMSDANGTVSVNNIVRYE